jgi:hypothetical protein
MAIKNASDLLVYAKTTSAVVQETRIYVRNDNPISLEDGETFGRLNLNNVTNASGAISDALETGGITYDSASSVLNNLNTVLVTNNGYQSGSNTPITINGVAYTYRDFTNGANGIVPTLEVVDGTGSDKGTINEGAIIIEIITPGSSAIFDPVAFSTSASFSTNMDLRDITNKDSGGWSESLGGLRSFEVSTDILQSINPDVPLDGTDFFDKLKARSLVDLSFSDRIRNIIRTNLTQSGVDGFGITNGIDQTNLQDDPFGGSTASKLSLNTSGANFHRIYYSVNSSRIENKFVTWTFYIKGDPSGSNNATATFFCKQGIDESMFSFEKLSGDGTIALLSSGNAVRKITGLNTGDNNVSSNWTRVRVTYNFQGGSNTGTQGLFSIAPGLGSSQTSGDSVITSSWQIELSPEATDYQDPTDITHWQGNALVSSVSFDAGVEDNLTCSATFTGTGNVYPNGLGPELIGDTDFNDPSYWTIDNSGTGAASVVETGYGKIITTSGTTNIATPNIMSGSGDYYLLTYTISSSPSPSGTLSVDRGWQSSPDLHMDIPSTQGTHSVLLYPEMQSLEIVRGSGATTIWLSSISLKKVL